VHEGLLFRRVWPGWPMRRIGRVFPQERALSGERRLLFGELQGHARGAFPLRGRSREMPYARRTVQKGRRVLRIGGTLRGGRALLAAGGLS